MPDCRRPPPARRVTLWVQNSQPCAIPAGAVGLNLMGDARVATLDRAIAPFATYALDVAALLPEARWPQQIEVRAGKYFVRPRYEVSAKGKRRIAHVNVERTDLRPDPKHRRARQSSRQGLSPAGADPAARALPHPGAADADGDGAARAAASRSRSMIAAGARSRAGASAASRGANRRRSTSTTLLNGTQLPGGYGHLELLYDFSDGGEADGWLHALFRYEHRASGHAAETSFGAHVFNTVLPTRASRNPIRAAPPACRRGSSCGWAKARSTRCAT